ncbi:MAG: DUF2238 domain-containing protein [Oscillospiraceae bacterium]|nr:DUF2238 domain-containing protein [Oscillospiraceae bacterium]
MDKASKILRIAFVAAGEVLTCATIIFLLNSGDSERLLLAFVTLLLVLIPGILERLLRCRICTPVYLFAVAYALGPMMGHCWKFYYTIPCWDRLLHFCGGVTFAILGMYLFERFLCEEAKPAAAIIFALCFSIAISAVWEFVEYGADLFLGMDMQDDTLVNCINSYMLGAEKGVTGSIDNIYSVTVNGKPLPVNGYIDIGLHDTMLDMIVESLGAIAICILLFIDKAKHKLIKTI